MVPERRGEAQMVEFFVGSTRETMSSRQCENLASAVAAVVTGLEALLGAQGDEQTLSGCVADVGRLRRCPAGGGDSLELSLTAPAWSAPFQLTEARAAVVRSVAPRYGRWHRARGGAGAGVTRQTSRDSRPRLIAEFD